MDEISPAYNNDEYNALFGAAPAARSAKPTTSLSTTTTTPVPAKEEKKVLPFQEPVKADDKDFPVFDDGELLLDDEPLDDEEFYDEEF